MCHITGLTRGRVEELCALIHEATSESIRRWPPVLVLHRSVVVTLAYLRRNRVQAELAEAFEVSQPTISRVIAAMTPLLAGVLEQCIPAADDLSTTATPTESPAPGSATMEQGCPPRWAGAVFWGPGR
ncbi:transposase family protein [Actinokineospora auranticolor]|uniref:helix-turn-helix domain-containing protein n=1 Tax=Actinokineospora auranticolor TaxID=155976 RepID=UPI000CEC0746|nr:transposase family protein [Actinokineospora auranticolor]